MRRLLCTALLLLCCAYGGIAAVVRPLPQEGQGPWDVYTASTDPAAQDPKKDSFKPIRFAVSAKGVDRILAYCKANSGDDSSWNDEVAENEEYGYSLDEEDDIEELCDVSDTEVTPALKRTLLMEVLPAALKLHSERLSVQPVSGKLVITKNEDYQLSPNCERVSIPKEHLQGIPNVDFVLYVGLSAEYERVEICSRDQNGRPTSAWIRFIPKEIAATRHFIRFAAHEIAHALGFEIETMKNYSELNEKELSGNKLRLVTSPTVVEKMKEQYKCDGNVIKGMALENEVKGSPHPHWERRIAKDELMSTYTADVDVTGAYYSALTLAVFDSMPFYRANFTMAESMSWGKNAGCDLLKGGNKDVITKKYPEMFCTDVKMSLQCTSDRFALGRCTKASRSEVKSIIPEEYQLFRPPFASDSTNDLTDGCPIIKPIATTSCESGDLELMPGSVVGNSSRCLKGEGLELKTPNKLSLSVGDICANIQCVGGKVKVQYKGSEKWHDCTDGKIEKLEGSEFKNGTILCPNYTEVCSDLKSDIEVRLTYDKGEEERMKEEEEEEDADQNKEEDNAQGEEKTREEPLTQHGLKQGTSVPEVPSADDGDEQQVIDPLTIGGVTPGKPKEEVTPQLSDNPTVDVPPVPQQVSSPQENTDGKDKESVVSPPSVEPRVPATDDQSNDNGNHSSTQQQEPAVKSPSAPTAISGEKQEPDSVPSTHVASESSAAVGHTTTSTDQTDQKNTNEYAKQEHVTVTQSLPQDGKGDGSEPIQSPKVVDSDSPVDGHKEDTVGTDSNTNNNTATSTNSAVDVQREAPFIATQDQGTASQASSDAGSDTESTAVGKPSPNDSSDIDGDTTNAAGRSPAESAIADPPSTPAPPPPTVPGSSDNDSSITSPENTTTTAVGTVKGINGIQVGEAMDHMGIFVGRGADSSTAASYYIPLLLLVCALVAVGSP